MSVDPEIFFPELEIRYNKKGNVIANTLEEKAEYALAVQAAKAVCNGCAFTEPCLAYALKNDVVGIWGGTDEKGRRSIRKKLKLRTPRSMNAITQEYLK